MDEDGTNTLDHEAIRSFDELESLRIVRGHIKSRLTRFKTFLEGKNVEENIIQLKLRLEKIEQTWEQFQQIQIQISTLQPSDEGSDSADYEEFEDNYFSLVAIAKSYIADKDVSISPASSWINNQPSTKSVAQLPKITLPTFVGKYEEFRSFYETFNSLINERGDLSHVQKFHYLRSSLKGEPLHLITSLEITEENYKSAWELLKARYENKKLAIMRHMKAITEVEKIDKESAAKLRNLIDNTMKHLRALKAMNLPTDEWDVPLVYILSQKLDIENHKRWETATVNSDVPKLDDLIEYLQRRAHVLEAIESDKSRQNSSKPKFQSQANHAIEETKFICGICRGQHRIFNCLKFLKMTPLARLTETNKLGACVNCLRKGHKSKECISSTCRKCSQKHNTLLHLGKEKQPVEGNKKPSPEKPTTSDNNSEVALTNALNNNKSSVLLSTAAIFVQDFHGQFQSCRALLDSGAQANMITERMFKRLGLKREQGHTIVKVVGGSKIKGVKSACAIIRSSDGQFSCTLDFLVLPKITSLVPTVDIDISNWELPSDTTLADPAFFRKGHIDMILGAEEFYNIVMGGQMSLGPGNPSLRLTKLGWLVTGKVTNSSNSSLSHIVIEEPSSKFWETEECPKKSFMSQEELECETLFTATTTRNKDGRFIVNLPFKENISSLGESKDTAIRRCRSIEKRLERNPLLKEQYTAFIHEYINLGHAEIVPPDAVESNLSYYLPHHCVINTHSPSTKLRVVFDGSCRTSSGLSLNDTLMVGPKVQEDLLSIILRFRMHRIVITADITKMYRQVNVIDQHADLQRIVWRDSSHLPLQILRLNTVTYGTASASFQATRCLKQLEQENLEKYPLGARAVGRDFYVDDLLTGHDSLEDIKTIIEEVVTILNQGKFALHKWCSNNPALIRSLPCVNTKELYILHNSKDKAVKTLGLCWNPTTDRFGFISKLEPSEIPTKRIVLATIARIFDPLGLIGPFVVQAKMILQALWRAKLDWDEQLSGALQQHWHKFQESLADLEHIMIPRCVRVFPSPIIEVHGFCDASEHAYGAAIYIKSITTNQEVSVQLLASKSRVAPIKRLSIPRLELCGALLLAHLLKYCMEALQTEISRCFLWCDSQIVLAWIAQSPNRWKSFVANRVSEIQEVTSTYQWRHISSQDNPADQLSRGVNVKGLIQSTNWWHGPPWLMGTSDTWPGQPPNFNEAAIPEARCLLATATQSTESIIDFERFSNLNRLLNAIAYILRFKSSKQSRPKGPITATERNMALIKCILIVQKTGFSKEIKLLQQGKPIHHKSVILTLCPFLDSDNLLRVGGRLANADINFNQRHPMLLPPKCKLVDLIALRLHIDNCHAGPQLLLATMRQRFWPLNGRNLVRKFTHSCQICFRNNPKAANQLMGALPTARVTPARPFINTGVDFCGPILVRPSKRRGTKSIKAYIAIFICLATKAVFFELASDLTSDCFIATLKRFFNRRGKSLNLYSDNGKTFVGANKKLNQMFRQVARNERVQEFISQEGITWHFIPPRAPHFGGLWEAAVKNCKFHMVRVIGNASLTFEEATTILTSIEACLNSRPLFSLSSDPNDFNYLTPGHFLIGDALTAFPEPDLLATKENQLNRWQRLQRLQQHFWVRWQKEYLSGLQHRTKWNRELSNLQPGTMVILKDDNTPPLLWPLGRLEAIHQGTDDLARVASVRTAKGVFKRPLSRICPLPMAPVATSQD